VGVKSRTFEKSLTTQPRTERPKKKKVME